MNQLSVIHVGTGGGSSGSSSGGSSSGGGGGSSSGGGGGRGVTPPFDHSAVIAASAGLSRLRLFLTGFLSHCQPVFVS